MADRYQLVGTVNPTDRLERVQYAEGKFLEMKGEPQVLSDAQVAKLTSTVELRRIDEGSEAVAEFGPDPEEAEDEKKGAEEKKESSSGGRQGRS